MEVYWATALDMWHARRWRDKLLVWLKPPGWRPADVMARFPKPAFALERERYAPRMPPIHALLLAQVRLLLAMATQFLGLSGNTGLPERLRYAGYLLASLCLLGALMEGRRGAIWLEALRCMVTATLPVLAGRWFSIGRLDVRLGSTLLAVFGLGALAALWLSRHDRSPASQPRRKTSGGRGNLRSLTVSLRCAYRLFARVARAAEPAAAPAS